MYRRICLKISLQQPPIIVHVLDLANYFKTLSSLEIISLFTDAKPCNVTLIETVLIFMIF